MNQTEFSRVKAHPFHQYLGIEAIEAQNGKAKIEIVVTDRVVNPAGTFHGGVIYTICDITAFCALISTLEEKEIGVTNHISVQVLRAARLEEVVVFEAELVKKGKRLAFLEATAHIGGKIIAKASVTKTLLSFK